MEQRNRQTSDFMVAFVPNTCFAVKFGGHTKITQRLVKWCLAFRFQLTLCREYIESKKKAPKNKSSLFDLFLGDFGIDPEFNDETSAWNRNNKK